MPSLIKKNGDLKNAERGVFYASAHFLQTSDQTHGDAKRSSAISRLMEGL